MIDLFIEYANCDLKREREFFQWFIEAVKEINMAVLYEFLGLSSKEYRNCGLKTWPDSKLYDPDFRWNEKIDIQAQHIDGEGLLSYHPIFEKVDSYLAGKNFMEDLKSILFKNAGGIDLNPLESQYNEFALEGLYFNQYFESCKNCWFNDTDMCVPASNCQECIHTLFLEILDEIIMNEKLAFNQGLTILRDAKQAVTETRGFIEESGQIKEYSWVSGRLLCGNYHFPGQQHFSIFVMGCVGFNLIEFLKKDPRNIQRIKKCPICSEYFLSQKAGNQKRCKDCISNDRRESRAEYQKIYREKNNRKKTEDQLKAYMKMTGCSRKEAEEVKKEGLL